MRHVTAIALVCALAAWSVDSAAQPAAFADPTRPPNAEPEGGASAPAETRLQSVLIAPNRRVAVIDGQAVTVGQKVGDATLIRIAVGEVLLRQGAETRVLKLLPDVDKLRLNRAGSEGRSGKEGNE